MFVKLTDGSVVNLRDARHVRLTTTHLELYAEFSNGGVSLHPPTRNAAFAQVLLQLVVNGMVEGRRYLNMAEACTEAMLLCRGGALVHPEVEP